MATKTIAWNRGSGNITVTYGGSGDGTITIQSADNNLYEARSQEIVVQTTAGSPQVTKTITITQAAKMRIDLSAAIVTAANQTYNGSAKTPIPTVILDGETVPSTGYDVTYNNNTNAGTATVTVTGKGDYTGTASGTFIIAKANPVYAAPTANNRTYNTSSAALLVAGSNTTPGTFTYCATQSGTYSTTIPSQTNAGTYTTYWKFTPTDSNNYNSVGATAVSTTISPKTVSNPTITLSQSTYTYSGSACQPTPTVKDGTVTISSSEYTVSYSNNTNAGTATVTITDKSGGNYTVSGSTTFTINKANPTYTAPTAQSLTYSRSAQYLITTGSTSHGTIQYSSNGTSWSTTRPQGTNAGEYTSYWRLVGDSNHNDVASTSITTTIAKRTPVVATAPSLVTGLTYTGSAQNLLSGGSMKHSSSVSTAVAGTFTYAQQTNAGTYSNPTWSFVPTDTTNYNNASGSVTGSVTIAKAAPSYTAPVANALTYTGSSQYLITTGSTSHGTIQYSTNGTSWSTTRPSQTNAGTYTAYWKLVGDTNHNDVASTQISNVGIAQKALTITAKAQSISYGGSIATGTSQVTTSGLVSGDTLTAVTLTASTSDVTTSGTITPSAASTTKGVGNYNVTYNTGNLTITAVPASVTTTPTAKTLSYTGSAQALVNAGTASGGTMYYKMTTTNSKPTSTSGFSASIPTGTNAGSAYYVWYYVKGDSNHTDTAISSTAVNVTISKAAINPTVSMNGWTYGGTATNPSVSGNSGSGSVTYSYKLTSSPDSSYSSTKPSNAGDYTVRAVITETTNYLGATCTNTFTISKATPTYTAPAAIVPTYSRSAQNLVSAGSTSHGTITYSTSQSGTYSSSIPQGTDAGTYTVWWKLTGDSNHTDIIATQVSGVSIATKALTEDMLTSWNSPQTYTGSQIITGYAWYYGTYKLVNNTDFTYTITKNGTTVTSATNAGTYNYTFTGQGNYSGSYVAVLVVNPATGQVTTAPTANSLTYTSSNQYLITAGSGTGTMYYRSKLSTSSTWSSWSTSVPSQTNAGTYNVEYYAAASTNYTQSATGTLDAIIAKASRTLSFADTIVVLPPSGTVTKTATLSAGDGTITYTIASTTYATINSSTGAVTAKTTEGNTTVTASVPATTNYVSATSSYSLYVFAETHNYSYSGSTQTVALPPGSYKLQCWGAQGGSNAADATYGITAQAGGKGGYSEGILNIANPTTVKVNVGGQGSSTSAGWNGGGSSTGSSTYYSSGIRGVSKMAAGGGATDIRLSDNALLSRMIVAGGGSGGAMLCKQEQVEEEVTLETYTTFQNDGWYPHDGTGKWIQQANYAYGGCYFDITAYQGKSVSMVLNATYPNRTYVSFYEDLPVVGESWNKLGGMTSSTTSMTIPSTAKCMFVFVNYEGNIRSPQSVTITETQTVTQTSTVAQPGYAGGGTSGEGVSPGTQTSAGSSGSFGQGANVSVSNYRYCSAAGGGGWYGGGRSYSDNNTNDITYTGGGSGFVNIASFASNRPSGYTGLELDSGETKDGDTSFPSTSGGTETGHSGNGYARITRIEAQNVYNFDYTGAVQNVSLPAGTYKLEAWGAQGGSINTTYVGGKGGYSVGELTLAAQTTLYVYVGGQGTGGTSTGAKAGGFNGGGLGYSTSSTYVEEGGGGASDIRIGQDSLYARVIVAGGGGGAGSYNSTTGRYSGGYAGGTSGGTGGQYSTSYRGGTGGSQTARGTSYYGSTSNSTTYGDLAAFGIGGGAKSGTTSYQITGGGSGWYGGGYSRRGGGGGGSGYVYNSSTASSYPSGCLLNSNYHLTNSSTTAGNVSITSPSGSTETGHEGNGYVRITKL